jgi:hypothetical protein
MRRLALFGFVLGGCLQAAPAPPAPAPARSDSALGATHVVTVDSNGNFWPPTINVHGLDTVEWQFTNADDAVVASSATGPWLPNACLAPKAWDDAFNFAGPLPVGASGVWTMGPFSDDKGFEESDLATGCSDGSSPVVGISRSSEILCATNPNPYVMTSTWESDDLRGVHLRMLWSDLQPDITYFNTAIKTDVLDHEMNAAVQHGKLFSISIKAGKAGTPDWIFSTERTTDANGNFLPRMVNPGPVMRLQFQDGGDQLDPGDCGSTMFLGNPAEQAYQDTYEQLLEQLAAHIKSRDDWYRALAYVKLGGTNLITDEARLPRRCTSGCAICNPKVWAFAGYKPSKLYDFYTWERQRIGELFPGKAMAYQLIQSGFPRVSENLCWLHQSAAGADETQCLTFQPGGPFGLLLPVITTTAGTTGLPGAFEQTQHVLDDGAADATYGRLFVVQHNGLKSAPAPHTCPTYHVNPATGSTTNDPPGCPNHWVLKEGALSPVGQLTGFQTTNAQGGVNDAATLDSAFTNMMDNSDGMFLEAYEQRHWETRIYESQGYRQPSLNTLADWSALLDGRRSTDSVAFTGVADPNVKTFRHMFGLLIAGTPAKTIYYYNPTRCGLGAPRTGTIILSP